jgi:amidase
MNRLEPGDFRRVSYKDGVEYRFGHRADPRLRVSLGESIICETEDSFIGQMYDHAARPTSEFVPQMSSSPVQLNPVTGPIFVDGVQAGDVLVVNIEKVVPASRGFTIIEPRTGPLARNVDWPLFLEPHVFQFDYLEGPGGTTQDGDLSALNGRIRFPLRPFVGTIGVSPEHEEVSTVVGQGDWGGNIDCRDVTEGSRVYLNSYHEGGLFFLGDMHAAQGDMEFFGTAAEARGEIQLSFDVVPNKRIPFIRVEKPESIIQLYCDRPLEDAVRSATIHLMEWLRDEYGLSEEESFLQVAINPDFRMNIYQCVRLDRLAFTVGAELPRSKLTARR